MESKMKSFAEQEKLFREKTGKEFTQLYSKYYPKLIYFTSRICNDQQKAEDLSTDSFMIALDKIEKYDKEKSQFSTWLFTIAKNLTLQDMKVEKRSISLDIEFDNEGTTMKDFIQEEESDLHVQDVSARKAEIMKKYVTTYTIVPGPLQKIIPMDPNKGVYMIAYSDNYYALLQKNYLQTEH